MMGNHSQNPQFSGAGAPAISSAQAAAIYATGPHRGRTGIVAKMVQAVRNASRPLVGHSSCDA